MISTRYLILNELLEAEKTSSYISGQRIAEKLNISRNAVNKGISSLKTEGYDIRAITNKGYMLKGDPNLINHGELLNLLGRERTENIAIYDNVTSTNVVLHELAESGAPNGQVVIARSQSAGRGRSGASFDSPEDNSIYMSYLIRPTKINEIRGITPAVTDIVAAAIKALKPDMAGMEVKYPGDIMLGGRKICGVLTEVLMEAESGYIRYIMTGIGIRPIGDIKRAALVTSVISAIGDARL